MIATVDSNDTKIDEVGEQLRRFFDYVLPALDEHCFRHSLAVSYLQTMYDEPQLVDVGCGPTAFSALFGVQGDQLHGYFPEMRERPWVNRRDMEYALRERGCKYAKLDAGWPTIGFCLIHWRGPWTTRGYAHSILKRSHWVAVAGDYVFDINWRGWLPKENWEDVVIPELLFNCAANGWQALSAYELLFG